MTCLVPKSKVHFGEEAVSIKIKRYAVRVRVNPNPHGQGSKKAHAISKAYINDNYYYKNFEKNMYSSQIMCTFEQICSKIPSFQLYTVFLVISMTNQK